MSERLIQRFSDNQSIPNLNQTVSAYREAFAGYPWFEKLSDLQVQERIEKDLAKPGFGGVWFLDREGDLIGASWYYSSDSEKLQNERGKELSLFAERELSENGIKQIVWHSMTLVAPKYQRQGVGTELKRVIFEDMQERANKTGPILYLTRIRDDNTGSRKMNEPYGLQRTGIKVPSSQVQGLMHEYWFKVITPQNNL